MAIQSVKIVGSTQAGELGGLTEKTTLSANDLINIEDSGASNVDKKLKIGTLFGTKEIIVTFQSSDGTSEIADNAQAWICVPFACTISSWDLTADQSGSITIDVWKDTYANFPPTNADSITNGHEPALSTAQKAQDTDLSDWSSVTITANDYLMFNVDSCTTITKAVLILKVVL